MFDNLYESLRGVLFQRWNARLRGILSGAARAESSGMSASDAFKAGYQEAYFDAVSDLIEGGFIKEPVLPAEAQGTPVVLVSDDVH